MPTNFKTYEAQSRLLVAVLASIPELKLNFKAIAKHYGSDATESGMEHRFRPIKKHVQAIRLAVQQNRDAKDLADMIIRNDKDIAKYYGESTPGGIEFQFRTIKKEAKAMRDAVEKGQSPLSTRKSTVAMTPQSGAKRKAGSTAATTPRTKTPGAKRVKMGTTPAAVPPEASSGLGLYDGEDDDDDDLPPLDATPSHRPKATAVAAAPPPPPRAPAMPTPSVSLEATPSEDGGDYSFVEPPSQAVTTPAAGGGGGGGDPFFIDSGSWAKDEDFSGLADELPPNFGDQAYSFEGEV